MTRVMLASDAPPVGFKVIAEYKQDGQYAVRLLADRRKRLAVQYGLQLEHRLSYLEATSELGECLLHQLTCAGAIDE